MAVGGRQAGDADDGTSGWIWVIVVLLIIGAVVAGAMLLQRWSNQRTLNALFQNGGAQSRSISIRPGRSVVAGDDRGDGGNLGVPVYANPTYADPTYGAPSSGGIPLAAAGAVTPVYHVSGDTAGAGVVSPLYQIPIEVAAAEDGPGYLEVKAVANQMPMYRVLEPGTGSMRSMRSAVSTPQLYNVRSAPPADGGSGVQQQPTYGQIAPSAARPGSVSGGVYQTLNPRDAQSSA